MWIERNKIDLVCKNCGTWASEVDGYGLLKKFEEFDSDGNELFSHSITMCKKCDTISCWNNEIAPFPVLVWFRTPYDDNTLDLLIEYANKFRMLTDERNTAFSMVELFKKYKGYKRYGIQHKDFRDDWL